LDGENWNFYNNKKKSVEEERKGERKRERDRNKNILKKRNNIVIIDGWPGGRVVGSYIGTITNITKDSPLP
jgi:preprotein translocase subunit Sec63